MLSHSGAGMGIWNKNKLVHWEKKAGIRRLTIQLFLLPRLRRCGFCTPSPPIRRYIVDREDFTFLTLP